MNTEYPHFPIDCNGLNPHANPSHVSRFGKDVFNAANGSSQTCAVLLLNGFATYSHLKYMTKQQTLWGVNAHHAQGKTMLGAAIPANGRGMCLWACPPSLLQLGSIGNVHDGGCCLNPPFTRSGTMVVVALLASHFLFPLACRGSVSGSGSIGSMAALLLVEAALAKGLPPTPLTVLLQWQTCLPPYDRPILH